MFEESSHKHVVVNIDTLRVLLLFHKNPENDSQWSGSDTQQSVLMNARLFCNALLYQTSQPKI